MILLLKKRSRKSQKLQKMSLVNGKMTLIKDRDLAIVAEEFSKNQENELVSEHYVE